MAAGFSIIDLYPAKCSDRSIRALGPDPTSWIEQGLPSGWETFSFHFFVDWSVGPPSVGDLLLFTRLVKVDAGVDIGSIGSDDVLEAFRASGDLEKLERLKAIFTPYKRDAIAILLPEIELSKINDDTPIWTVRQDKENQPKCLRSTVRGLKESIRNHSGGPVAVGQKGLIFGTSAIECYLSKTDAAYPGDVDLIVTDASGEVRHIFEFKKHTLAGEIGENLADRYYPKPDGRKYQRLFLLNDVMRNASGSCPKFIIFYFATQHPHIRIQVASEIDAERITIAFDSGDICVEQMSDKAIAEQVRRVVGDYQ